MSRCRGDAPKYDTSHLEIGRYTNYPSTWTRILYYSQLHWFERRKQKLSAWRLHYSKSTDTHSRTTDFAATFAFRDRVEHLHLWFPGVRTAINSRGKGGAVIRIISTERGNLAAKYAPHGHGVIHGLSHYRWDLKNKILVQLPQHGRHPVI